MTPLPFHPLINSWFSSTYGKPTAVQEEAWPLIGRGEHVLALAPTGSGKTLTGFLAAISRIADGTYPADRLSVLYVSPLKALNEDIKRNLIFPLEGIRKRFEEAGENIPAIRAETRSGDTPQSERRRFLLRPPSILALTPESLGILLLNPRGREALSTVRFVIIDEIHATLGSKRGSYLSCQIDRLALIAGEFQRVALSATVRPPEAAAEFAGGLREIDGKWEKRKLAIVAPNEKKEIKFQVIFSGLEDENGTMGDGENTQVERYGNRYAQLIRFIMLRIREALHGGKDDNSGKNDGSILVFTDSRRRAERISYLLNQAAARDPDWDGKPLAYTHHGSLSLDVRRAVEKALAAGEIPCVVATGSLELGIDIGGVKEVILAGSPGSAAVALQRVGRSGHRVGGISRGWLIPFHGIDLIQAAAVSLSFSHSSGEIEETSCIENPLDILAQLILALCAERDRNEEELFRTIRGFYVYRNLSRESYDGVIRMLAGAYEGTRLRELKRHLFRDEETGILSAAPGTLLLLYTSGGVIASRGYYSLRLASGGKGQSSLRMDKDKAAVKIGELDEEFVWERRLGDCFDFGNRSWRIIAIGSEAVEVIPLESGADSVPFWKGETVYRSSLLSQRMLDLFEGYHRKGWTSLKAEKMLECFSNEAKTALENFLREQSLAQGTVPLPGPEYLPIEIINDPGRGDAFLIILHSFRGGAVNAPLSLALARDLEVRHKARIEAAADDNAVFIRIPRSICAGIEDSGSAPPPAALILESLRRLCEGGKGEERFRERLESSGVFGAAFREAAERSLILPRSPYGKRTPLWLVRQKSKRLFDAVKPYHDFPITAEAWRSCLKEQFDMAGFTALLDEIADGALIVDFFATSRTSPFSREMAWNETNALMYEYDERPDLAGPPSADRGGPSLSDRVIAEALGDAGARPPLKAEISRSFCSRLRRELPGWAPEDALTLCEWVKERIAIPYSRADVSDVICNDDEKENTPPDEWERLLEFIPPELAEALYADRSLGGKLIYLTREGAGVPAVVHRDWAKKWMEMKAADLAASCLGQWLRYEGPIPLSRIESIFGLTALEAEEAAETLLEREELVRDVIVEGEGENLFCDRENCELILRLGRRRQRPETRERPAQVLVPFLARRGGILPPKNLEDATPVTGENGLPWERQSLPWERQSLPWERRSLPWERQNFPWERLAGIIAPAKLWETEFFPYRCPSYSGEMLDKEIREGRLIWYGAGRERAAFCRPEDLDLVLPESSTSGKELIFAGKLPVGFFDLPKNFWEIKDALAAFMEEGGAAANKIISAAEMLWEEAWEGRLSADSWDPVRRALEMGFTSAESSFSERLALNDGSLGTRGNSSALGRRSLRVPRAIRERWKAGPPVRGNWFSLAGDFPLEDERDILLEEELNRDRVRLLLDRYGILARPLLEREAPCLSWARLLPAMRRMELSGELVAGRFFAGINSLQFASPRIAEELEEAEAERGIYWMNAADPASPAGLAVGDIMSPARVISPNEQGCCEPATGGLPPREPLIRRIPSSRLCFRGSELIAASRGGGKDLEVFIAADDPDIEEALAFIKTGRTRMIQTEHNIVVETINGNSAASSAYGPVLASLGFVRDRGRMVLW